MHDLESRPNSEPLIGLNSRSSVASKRFPLSNEWLARFRFAWVFSRKAAERGG
jgi:hypothetical protein